MRRASLHRFVALVAALARTTARSTGTPALVCMLVSALVCDAARADERSNALDAPRRGSTEQRAAPVYVVSTPYLELMPQRWVDRPLVLPGLVVRSELTTVAAGGGPYSATLGFVPAVSVGVGGNVDLTLAVPLYVGVRTEPRLGAHWRFFGRKEVEVGARALLGVPTGPDVATADVALTLLWRATPWLRLDSEVRGGFAFESTVRAGLVWPVIVTFQASSGFFVGATTELGAFPELGRVTFAAGGFLGGTLEHDGRALCDLRIGAAARDLASNSVGAELLVYAAFYGDPR